MTVEQNERLKSYLKFLSDTRGVVLNEALFIEEIDKLSQITDLATLEVEYKEFYKIFAKDYMHKIYNKVYSSSGDRIMLSKDEELKQVSKRIGTVNTMITAIMNSDIFSVKLPVDKILFGGLTTAEFIKSTRFDETDRVSRADNYLNDMKKRGLSTEEDVRNSLEDTLTQGVTQILRDKSLKDNHEKKMEYSSRLMNKIAPAYITIVELQKKKNPICRVLSKNGRENKKVLNNTITKLSKLTSIPAKAIKEKLWLKAKKDSFEDKTISYERILLKNHLIDEFKKQALDDPNSVLAAALAFDKNAEKHYGGEYYFDDVEFVTEALSFKEEPAKELEPKIVEEEESEYVITGETYRSPKITFNRSIASEVQKQKQK